jgi:N-acetyl sugar amidotransferase
MILQYCNKCLYPNTKPDLSFNYKGVCSACTAFEQRKSIDWADREKQFKKLVYDVKLLKRQYDCVIPVSGGKDSTWQVLKALEYDLNPLCVTATTDFLSGVGRHNLDNIGRLGVDCIEVSTNAKVRRKINAYTLREVGDISWAEHTTIFSIPIRIALDVNVPLILYGENPQHEYGGPSEESQKATVLDNRWLQEFGGLNGLRVRDIIDAGIATQKDMHLYCYPTDTLGRASKAMWLGQFFPWDGAQNALIASQNGFKCWHGPVEGTGYSYENLDNLQTGAHDYFKWIKFGFGRATDLVCNHIRRGNITRNEGKHIILDFDGQWPSSYLGISLEEILEPLEMKIEEFIDICDRFTNTKIFRITKRRPRPTPLFLDDLKNA